MSWPDAAAAQANLASAGLAGASLVLVRLDIADGARLEVAAAARLEVRPAEPLSPASMIKVPIAAALAAHWASGSAQPEDRVEVAEANLTANDAPSPLVPGYRARLDELGHLMLTRSDNVATNVLIDVLGRERITLYCRGLGLNRTAVRRKLSGSLPLIEDPGAAPEFDGEAPGAQGENSGAHGEDSRARSRNAHPAGDAARLFEAIAHDGLAGAAWLRETLGAQEWNDKLSLGLEPGDHFAHKTGDTDEVSHDGGILTTAAGARYVIVVYAPVASPEGGDERFGRLMRALRPLL